MSTLKNKELKQLDDAVKNAIGLAVDKDKVLKIIVSEIKRLDIKNEFIVDKIDVAALKTIYNEMIKL